MTDRHIYKIDDGESHWYSAVSDTQAIEMFQEHYGYPDEELSIDEVSRVDDAEVMIVICETANGNEQSVTHTAREWADLKPGFVASTLY